MNFYDRVSGVIWLAVSLFVCAESAEVGVGTFPSPGPGFLPFWSGMVLGLLAISLIITRTLKKKRGEKRTDLWEGKQWGKIVLALLALLIYSLVLPKLGYLIATFGLLTLLFGMVGKVKIGMQGLSALITVSVTYLIFSVWLNIPLPKGLLGF